MKKFQRVVSGWLAGCILFSMLPQKVSAEQETESQLQENVCEHEYSASVTEATCTEQGYTTYSCECGDSYQDDNTDPLGHDWCSWMEMVEPTCTEQGTRHRDCLREGCGAVETETIASAGHSFGGWYETVEATREEAGEEQRDCENCDHFETRETEKLPQEEPDMDPSGSCGENLTWCFEKSTGTLTVSGTGEMEDYVWDSLDESVAVPWLDYYETIEEIIVESGVTSIGEDAFRGCINAVAVSLSEGISSIGSYSFADCDSLTEIRIPESVKTVGESAFSDCSGLEEVTIRGAETIGDFAFSECAALSSVELPDSLTAIGAYSFRGCEKLKEITIPGSVRIIGEFAFVWCDNLETIVFEGSAPEMENSALSELTCTAYYPDGDDSWSETYLREFDSTVTWVAVGGGSSDDSHSHSLGDWYETKAATQETEGEERRECSDCDYYEIRKTEKLPFDDDAHEHSYSAEVIAPTCTEEGYTYYSCDCGEGYEEDFVDATGHNYVDSICTACGQKESEPPHEHNYSSEVIEPTCTEEGYTSYTCDCGEGYEEDFVDAIGHRFGEWYESKAATQEAEGEERRECENCDHYETRELDKLPTPVPHEHSYSTEVTEPSCNAEGFTLYFCDCGDMYMSDYTDALGHSFGGWYETKKPTHDEEGEERRDCKNCDHQEKRIKPILAPNIVATGSCGEIITWTLDKDGLLSISGSGEMINASWGNYYSDIVAVELSDGVTNIVKDAFSNHNNLRSVIIPSSVKNIGYDAFFECGKLADITFEHDKTDELTIEERAFDKNFGSAIDTLIHVSDVNQICDALTVYPWASSRHTVTYWDGEKNIRYCGDYLSWELTEEGVLVISGYGEMAYFGEYYNFDSNSYYDTYFPWETLRDQIKRVILPDGITTISISAFAGCKNLTQINLPDGITSVGDRAFEDCSSLSSVILPERTTYIGEAAFRGCGSLKSVAIPYGVTTIWDSAFEECYSLESVAIPDSVSCVYKRAFKYCHKLKEIVLPEGINEIRSSTFSDCYSLQMITIPSTVSSIDNYAFSGCKNLQSIVLPDNVTYIGTHVFAGSGLQEIIIPRNVEDISGAFGEQNVLTNIRVDPQNTSYIDLDGVLYDKNQTELIICPAKKIGNIIIPSSVTKINANAFAGCSEITGIVIPSNISELGDKAFYGCSKLKNIEIPLNISSIPDYAFANCSSLTNVVIPSNISEIDTGAFAECCQLQYITVPISVKTINAYAFKNCNSLTDVYYEGSESDWEKLKTNNNYHYALEKAVVHYNSTGPNKGYTGNGTVLYFSKWNADTQTAYFGSIEETDSLFSIAYQVTEETDTSFIDDIDNLLNNYVLVESKPSESLVLTNELISIHPVETKTGAVTEIGFTTITIDGVEYSIPESVNVFGFDVGDLVMYHLYNGNLVGICVNDAADDDSDISAANMNVRYYNYWDATNKVAQFGPNDGKGLQVTDETDIFFKLDPSKYLGQYVLVGYEAGRESSVWDLLITMKPVETRTGTVTSVEGSSVTIDGRSYDIAENLGSLSEFENQIVVYHLYKATLVGIAALEEKEGVLTYWNKDGNAINIKATSEENVELYHLSSAADEGTAIFLDTVANQETEITYLSDGNNLVYNARKNGYRLAIDTKGAETTIEVGKTVTIYASLLCNDNAVDNWKAPEVLLDEGGSDEILSCSAWKAYWPHQYTMEISGIKSGKVELIVWDPASNATATISITVIPEDPLDGLSHEEWIQKHIDYTNSSAYKDQIVPGFGGILLDTYDNAKNNKWTSAYSTLDGINKVLSFDGEKLDKTREYELLLAQILFRRTGVIALENMYNDFLSSSYIEVLDILLTIPDNIAGLDKETLELIQKLDDFASGSEEFDAVLDAVLKNLNGTDEFDLLKDVIKEELSFASSGVMDLMEDTCNNMGEYVTYLAAGEAYLKTSDAFGKMLLVMRSHINVPSKIVTLQPNTFMLPDFGYYSANEPFEEAQLAAAIENFYTSLESYKKVRGKEIAGKALERYKKDLTNSAVDNTLDVVVSILECIPVVKAFSVVREMFDGTQFAVEKLTSIDEQEYHGTMLIRLYCMEQLHYITVDGYAKISADWGMRLNQEYEFDPELQFEQSVLFDESVAVYRAIASVAADYAEQYLAASYLPSVGEFGHPAFGIPVSDFDAVRAWLDCEWCHSAYATFEEYCNDNGIILLDRENLVEYKFKCPVDITVKDERGSVVAVLRNGKSDITEGYEHYFFTTELKNGSGEYLKVAYVPASYDVSVKGTGTGYMDVYVSTYTNSQVNETKCFLNVPITESTEGYFADGDEISGAKVLHIDGGRLNGEPVEEAIHSPGTEMYSDGINHWRKCTGCNEKLDVTAHSGGTATCTQKAVCTVCGTSYGKPGFHDYKTAWSQGNAYGHWHECRNCSAHDTQIKHTPGPAATETKSQTCTECGYVIVPATGHVVHTAGSKWFSDGNSHWRKCTGCNEKLDVTAHSGGTATCTKKAICAVCGTSYGKLGTHDYGTAWSQGDANGHWHECKICSAHDTQIKHTSGPEATESKSQKCTVCGYVIKAALGHSCTAGSKWHSSGSYHWHTCVSCGAWVSTGAHSYSSDRDTDCGICGYVRIVAEDVISTVPTEELAETAPETAAPEIPSGIVVVEETEMIPQDTSAEPQQIQPETRDITILRILIITAVILSVGIAIILVYLVRSERKRK